MSDKNLKRYVADIDKGQQVWDFTAECEGMCGV